MLKPHYMLIEPEIVKIIKCDKDLIEKQYVDINGDTAIIVMKDLKGREAGRDSKCKQ